MQTIAAQLQNSQDVVAAVLRAVSDRAIVIADADGRITAVNRAAERLLGYTAAELIGRSTLCLYDPDDIAVAAAELGLEPGLDPLLEITRSGLPNLQEWAVPRQGRAALPGQPEDHRRRRSAQSLRLRLRGERPHPRLAADRDVEHGFRPAAARAGRRADPHPALAGRRIRVRPASLTPRVPGPAPG